MKIFSFPQHLVERNASFVNSNEIDYFPDLKNIENIDSKEINDPDRYPYKDIRNDLDLEMEELIIEIRATRRHEFSYRSSQ